MASEARVPRWRPLAAMIRGRRAGIWALVVATATMSAVLWFAVVARLGTVDNQVPWWVLALAVTACEAFPVHLEVRGEAHSVTLTEIPIVIGLLLSAPHALLVAQLLGVNTARFAFRRQSPIKHAFNAAVSTLDVTLAITLFHGLAGHRAFGP